MDKFCCLLILLISQLIQVSGTPPVLSSSPTGNVDEDDASPAIGRTVTLDFTWSDPDGDTLTYAISGADAAAFTLTSSSSPAITTAVVLDRETKSTYSFTLQVDDGNTAPVTTQTITISINDINDNKPSCPQLAYFANIPENSAAGVLVTSLSTEGCSGGGDVNDPISLISILSGDGGRFSVSGQSIVTSGTPLDFESTMLYTMVVQMVDTQSPVQTGTVSIYVQVVPENDNIPSWSTFTPGYVSPTTEYSHTENSAVGTSIVTMTATDADLPVGGPHSTLQYTILSVTDNNGANAAGTFFLARTSGVLYNSQQLNHAGGISYYDVIIQASDGVNVIQRTLRVGITSGTNDHAPEFDPSYFTASIEQRTNSPDSVITLTATDDDPDDVLTYSILDVRDERNNDRNGANYFTIGTDGKTIEVDNRLGDKGTDPYYVVTVEVSDGTYTDTAKVYITLTDNNRRPNFIPFNPTWSDQYTTYTVAEDAAIGTKIVEVRADDPDGQNDINGYIVYKLLDAATLEPITELFGLDNDFDDNDWDRYDADVITIGELDFETTSSYTVKIRVEDKGGPPLSRDREFIISVTDVNDNYPIFSQSSYTANIVEDLAVGTPVIQLPVTDGDTARPLNPTYTIVFGDALGRFDTGPAGNDWIDIKNVIDIDMGHPSTYELTVRVVDETGGLSSTTTVWVTVDGINDKTPVWGGWTATVPVSIAEDTAPATSIFTITATDADIGVGGDITYTITSATHSLGAVDATSWFDLRPDTGVLSTLKPFDYETVTSYQLVVQASDGTNSITRSFDVNIDDINDNDPVFSADHYDITINEGQATDTLVATFSTTDVDSIFTPTYTILSSTPANKFRIDGGTLEISTAPIDLDSPSSDADFYTVVVKVQDQVLTPRSSSSTFYITVLPVNQHDPVWVGANTPLSIPENTAADTPILTLAATDDDIGSDGDIIYSIVSVTNNLAAAVTETLFYVDPSTGVLKALGPFDYESGVTSYSLLVKAEDQGAGPRSITKTVTVSITDVNDNAPVLNQALYLTSVTEEDPSGTSVQLISATDTDTTPATFGFSIISGDTTKFSLSSAASSTTLEVNAVIDLETDADFYELVVQVTDEAGAGALTSTATVLVNVLNKNDFDPAFGPFSPTAPHNLLEDDPVGTTVFTMSATDSDAAIDGQYVFEIVSVVDSASAAVTPSPFAVNPANGELITTAVFDYEAMAYYDVVVKVKDLGTPVRSSTSTVRINIVDVNDNIPTFLPQSVYHVTTVESDSSGTQMLQFSASDADTTPATFTYSIQSGNTAKFIINVDWLEINNVIDLDVGVGDPAEYILEMIVTDQAAPGDLTGTATVYVKVTPTNDHVPVFGASSPAGPYSHPENMAVGTSIVTINAADDDFGETVVFSILSITDSEGTSDMTKFEIDGTSGELATTRYFDREGGTSGITYYDIVVQASDGTNSVSQTVRVDITDVNDNPPVFTLENYDATITEGTVIDISVIQVAVTDADPTAVVHTFAINPSSTKFRFDLTNTDDIEVAAVVDLDSGDPDEYVLTIEASDGVNTGTASVFIHVTSTNDHPPVFGTAPTGTVAENSASGTLVATVTASDNDYGTDGQITFSITGGDPDDLFHVDMNTGVITVKSLIDIETLTANPISLQVTATDGGLVPQTAVQTVVITVTDVNDNTPTCTSHSHVTGVDETITVGTLVVQLTCTDVDTGETLAYNIFSGDTANDFSIDSTGRLQTAKLLDYDAAAQDYSMVIHVKDNGALHTASVLIDVAVNPINEFSPAYAPVTNTITYSEGTAIGSPLILKAANDGDLSPHDVVNYQISSVSGGNTDTFQIDSGTGQLSLSQTLLLSSSPYEVVIIATDGGGSKGTGTVSVVVTDVNNNVPSCTPASHNINIPENQALGVIIASLGCTDPDTGAFGAITYSISQSPGTGSFTVSAAGAVSLAAAQDYESGITSYQLQVTAADDGGSGNAVIIPIQVTITAVNEAGPVFGGPYAANILEDAAIGASVIDVVATDVDGNTHPHGKRFYSIISGDVNHQFLINPNTGRISVASDLDRETTTSYTLKVQATEEIGTNSATVDVTVTIDDVDDTAPTCTLPVFSVEVPESTGTPYTVLSLGCSDADTSSTLSYAITAGDTSKFSVTGAGDVQMIAAVDFDAGSRQYDLTIRVSDNAPTPNTLEVKGPVIITGVNEHTPTFVPASPYTISVSEDETPNTVVITITATDLDSADTTDGQVSYTAVLGANPMFALDRDNGDITLVGNLDRETTPQYIMEIEASDGMNSATATLTISVSDINDNAPVFNPVAYSTTLSESTAVGTTILTVTATDADDPATSNNGVIVYAITGGNVGGTFSIVSTTGEFILSAALDYEFKTSYSLEVSVYDRNGAGGFLFDKATIIVVVTGVNEAAPVFTPSSTFVTVSESLIVGSAVTKVTATDADKGTDGELYYTMPPSSLFELDENTGDIILKAALDYEVSTSHTLAVTALDRGSPQRSVDTTVTVTVSDENDNEPDCSPDSYSDVQREDASIGTVVATLSCTDADTGLAASLTYSILSVNGVTGSGEFAVSGTGVVSIASNLDYETTDIHSILVSIYDISPSPKSSSASVVVAVTDVNEHSPLFMTPPTAVSLGENSAVGTSLVQITASDQDIEDTISYSFNPANNYFMIDPDTAIIYVKSIIDRDTVPSITLNIQALDSGTVDFARSTIHSLVVTIVDANDVMPVFSPGAYSTAIDENDPVGTTVTTVIASDPDVGIFGQVSYSILSGNTDAIFKIDITTGEITIDDVTKLDYELTSHYDLVIEATDGGGNKAQADVSISIRPVNEATPQFTPSVTYTASWSENTAIGTALSTVTATDSDAGPDGDISYKIVSGGSKFNIDSKLGIITLVNLLDRESSTTHTVLIESSDMGVNPGVLSSTATLSLTVLDYNDNAPSCTPSVYVADVPEDASSGDSVTAITCVDNDDDPAAVNNAFTFSLVSASTDFAVDHNTGEVTIAGSPSLDYEASKSYTLTIRVTDTGTPALSTDVELYIHITGVNEYAPVFGSATYYASLPENAGLDTTLLQVTATDNDHGVDGEFSFVITGGNTNGEFHVEESSGEVKLINPLDREQLASYDLIIEAVDHGSPSMTGTTTLSISVTDINDNSPVCVNSVYNGTIPEHSSPGTSVLTVSCTDSDFALNSVVQYSIVGGNTGSAFQIGASNGLLSVMNAVTLDAEVNEIMLLTIRANDIGTPAQSTTVSAVVILTDINDHTPVFTPNDYTVIVNENEPAGTAFITVFASDTDVGLNGEIEFSLSSGTPAGYASLFSIDSTTGVISLKSQLDYETATSHVIMVEASDKGTPSLLSSATVTVNVADYNDNAPLCPDTIVEGNVDEDATTGVSIITMSCTDADTDTLHITHQYSIIAGDPLNQFALDPSSGELSVNGALDYETTKGYILKVEVSDSGTPSLTSTAQMSISVNGVNEFDPVISTLTAVDIDEDTPKLTVIQDIDSTDSDDGVQGQHRYSITFGNSQNHFAVDENSGKLYVIGSLDREATDFYQLTVRATDSLPSNGDERFTEDILNVTILDVNDNKPVFVPSVLAIEVVETGPVGAILGAFTVTDDDIGSNALQVLSITSGNTGSAFTISGYNLIIASNLDHEVTKQYNLQVQAVDLGTPALTATAKVTINVLPENEFAHVPNRTVDTISVLEDIPVGSQLYTFDAQDLDSTKAIEYHIVSGDPSGVNFLLDVNTGKLTVGSFLDYDSLPQSYVLNVSVSDVVSGSPSFEQYVSLTINLVDVNDNNPVFSMNTYPTNIDEDIPTNTAVITAAATDLDSGSNGIIEYSIIDGDDTSGIFIIDNSTGVISTTTNLDRELQTSYTLIIQGKDQGSPSRSSTANVYITLNDINDNTPTFIPDSMRTSILENVPPGTSVVSVHAVDDDLGQNAELTFTIDPASDPNAHFSISKTTFKTADIITSALLDTDVISQYDLVITATDQGTPQLTGTATITIIVLDSNDNKPFFTNQPYDVSVSEDIILGTTVFDINTVDSDQGLNSLHTYQIVSGDNGNFQIDTTTGIITTKTNLDRETVSLYHMIIEVNDGGTPSLTSTITATVTVTDINDNPPQFIQTYSFSVYENVVNETIVGRVFAVDPDAGENATVEYSLRYTKEGLEDYFMIDNLTGTIYTVTNNLDREEAERYVIRMRAQDQGTPMQYSETDVVITIIDQNDYNPTCAESVFKTSVLEGGATGITILNITAIDKDENANGQLFYSIDSANASDYFSVNNQTGEVTILKALDREEYSSYAFNVWAMDQGVNPLSAACLVSITVTDVNDNVPAFSRPFFSTEVAVDESPDTIIIVISATDADPGSGVLFTFNPVSEEFLIDTFTGNVNKTFSSTLPPNTRYLIPVVATDTGTPSSSATVNLRIDTFVPKLHVVVFYVAISEVDSWQKAPSLKLNLENSIKNKYPSAVLHIWRIQKWETESSGFGNRRKRQSVATQTSADSASIYAYGVTDSSTYTETNKEKEKVFIPVEDLLAMWRANPDTGEPTSTLQGDAFDEFEIQIVQGYSEDDTLTKDSDQTLIIIIVVTILLLLLLIALSLIIYFCCCRNRRRKKKQPPVIPVQPAPQPVVEDVAPFEPRYKLDKVDVERQTKKLPPSGVSIPISPSAAKPPPQARDPWSIMKTPRPIAEERTFSPPPDYYDGIAVDPETGREYEYNSQTYARRWLKRVDSPLGSTSTPGTPRIASEPGTPRSVPTPVTPRDIHTPILLRTDSSGSIQRTSHL